MGADLGIRLLENVGCRFECVKSDFMDFGERYQMASCYGARYSRASTEVKRQFLKWKDAVRKIEVLCWKRASGLKGQPIKAPERFSVALSDMQQVFPQLHQHGDECRLNYLRGVTTRTPSPSAPAQKSLRHRRLALRRGNEGGGAGQSGARVRLSAARIKGAS